MLPYLFCFEHEARALTHRSHASWPSTNTHVFLRLRHLEQAPAFRVAPVLARFSASSGPFLFPAFFAGEASVFCIFATGALGASGVDVFCILGLGEGLLCPPQFQV